LLHPDEFVAGASGGSLWHQRGSHAVNLRGSAILVDGEVHIDAKMLSISPQKLGLKQQNYGVIMGYGGRVLESIH